MPFLVPAVVALLSDILVLWLAPGKEEENGADLPWAFHRLTYLIPLACIRLGLLYVYGWHSYHGTALPCRNVFVAFYTLSGGVLVIHAIFLLASHPTSLETIVPNTAASESSIPHFHWLRRVWYMLGLSLTSTVLQAWALVRHVSSTAPESSARPYSQPYWYRTSSSSSQNEYSPHLPKLQEVQFRLQAAKREWTSRLEAFLGLQATTTSANSTSLTNQHHALTIVLSLFAHQTVDWNTINANDFLFYIPQLCSFLLFGAHQVAPQLEAWMVQEARRNLKFGHLVYWFLRTWHSTTILTNTLLVDQPSSPDRPTECWNPPSQDSQHHGLRQYQQQDHLRNLMERLETSGQVAVQQFAEQSSLRQQGPPSFHDTPRFLDQLLKLAESLYAIPRAERKERFHQELRHLKTFLPSSTIYIPFAGQSLVYDIVVEESFPIHTKERVPCIICLQVMDTQKHGHDIVQAWQEGPRDPYRRASVLDRVVHNPLLTKALDTVRHRPSSMDWPGLVEEEKDEEWQALNTNTVPSPRPSRTNSGTSLVSMGQWGSPHKNEPPFPTYGSDADEEAETEAEESDATIATMTLTVEEASQPPRKKKPPVVFKESWSAKQERVRSTSPIGHVDGWRLLPILIKANDDLRQEQLASQLIQCMANILARRRVGVWLCPYKVLALTESAGIIQAIPDTISLDSLKRNDEHFHGLEDFFRSHFETDAEMANAKANFVESLAAYSMVCYLLQLKDRHNGNILLDSQGHVIHIDFGFFFLSSPGKNAGFESAPFKLTRDFCNLLEGPDSRLFKTFRSLCVETFLALRQDCMQIILLVEMRGNEELPCFCGRPREAIQGLKDRFRLDLNDRACREYVHSLVDDSMENWRTDWYDRYQRYFVGIL